MKFLPGICIVSLSPLAFADGPLLVPPALPPIQASPEVKAEPVPVVPLPVLVAPETTVKSATREKSAAPETDDDGYTVIKSRKRLASSDSAKRLSPNPMHVAPVPLAPIPLAPVQLGPVPIEPVREPNLSGMPSLVPASPTLSGPSLTGSNNPFPDFEPPDDLMPVPGHVADVYDGLKTQQEVSRAIDQMVLKAVPASYQNKDHWGQTKQVTTGVKLGFEGILLKANRVRRQVNHGDWRKFEFSRTTTKGSPYTVAVRKLKMVSDKQFTFTADYLVPYSSRAYLQSFSRGVSLRGLSVGATAVAKLTVECSVDFESIAGMDNSERQVELSPTILSSRLSLQDFNADEGNAFDRGAIRSLAKESRRILERQLSAHNSKGQLTRTLNDQLSDQIRLPLNELLATKWGKMLAGSTQLTQAGPQKKPRR